MSRSTSASRYFVILLALLAASILIAGVWVVSAQDAPTGPLEQPITYTVQPGDVLDLIAATFDVQVACLAELNDLVSPALIFPDNTLIISPECPPYDGASPVRFPRFPAGQGGGGSESVLVYVRPGDTLDTLGQRYNVSVVSLQLANNLLPGTLLFSGQQLVIPAGAPPYGFFPAVFPADQGGGAAAGSTYIIQPRDILDLIAAYFQIDLACLVERNNVAQPAVVQPGTELVIPSDCGPYTGFSSRLPGALGGLSITSAPVAGATVAATATPLPAQPTAVPPTAAPPTAAPPAITLTAFPTVPVVNATPTPETLLSVPTEAPTAASGGLTNQRPPTVTPTPGG